MSNDPQSRQRYCVKEAVALRCFRDLRPKQARLNINNTVLVSPEVLSVNIKQKMMFIKTLSNNFVFKVHLDLSMFSASLNDFGCEFLVFEPERENDQSSIVFQSWQIVTNLKAINKRHSTQQQLERPHFGERLMNMYHSIVVPSLYRILLWTNSQRSSTKVLLT